jgi:mannitol-1-phosphate 5-dehydrogenase
MERTDMKKVIAYGAGNIGRGFVGQLFHESGYEVVFVDVDKELVAALNKDHKYPIKIVSPQKIMEIVIDDVRAVDGTDPHSVAREISDADIMATAVGVKVLPRIVSTILGGLRKRWESNNLSPFNIILCENMIDSAEYMRSQFLTLLDDREKDAFDKTVGFVEASIGRMVPVMTKEMQEGNILKIWVEEYCMFPVDKDGFKGEIPAIKNLIPYSPFDYYIQRKLFIHNLGHALVAYLGYLCRFEFIWQGAGNRVIRMIAHGAMKEAAEALSKEHGADLGEIMEHVDDLVRRFSNRHLGDTVKRVGADPIRKLSPNDRLVGAARLCIKHGIDPVFICFGIMAALLFDPKDDASALRLQELIREKGKKKVLEEICGIEKESKLLELILGDDKDG